MPPETARGQKWILLERPERGPTGPRLVRLGCSHLQDSKETNSCCFEPPQFGHLSQQTEKTNAMCGVQPLGPSSQVQAQQRGVEVSFKVSVCRPLAGPHRPSPHLSLTLSL